MNPPQDPLLTVTEAAHHIGFSRRSLEREVAAKKFPPPIKLRRKSMFLLSDVTKYVERLKAERGAHYSPA